jgi:hypothetical protein
MIRPLWLAMCTTGMLIVTSDANASWPPGNILHPVAPPPPEVASRCLRLPQGARDHVHIFFVNGLDPSNVCNLRGLYDYVLALGFRQVYFGQMWYTGRYVKTIRQIRHDDPQARIVLLGYSIGANLVRKMAQDLSEDSTRIDLLVYWAGDFVRNSKAFKPDNVDRILNIRAWGLVLLCGGVFFNGADIDGCENHSLGLVRHSCVPASKKAQELLARELTDLAVGVQAHSAPAAHATQMGPAGHQPIWVNRCTWKPAPSPTPVPQ